MTLILRSTAGAIAANPTGFRPPVTRGLLGWFFHGGDAARSRKNLFVPDGSADATVVGTPTYAAYSMRCTGNAHYLQSVLTDPADVTLMTVASSPASLSSTDRPMFISNFSSNTVGGVSLGVSGGTPSAATMLASADFGTSIRGVNLTLPGLTTPRILFDTVTNGVGLTGSDETAGLVGSYAETAAREAGGAGPLRIGSSYNSGYLGAADIYATAVYGVALTAAERATLVTFLRGYYSRRGITV